MRKLTKIMDEKSQALELVRPEENPQHLMRRATDVAGVSRDIVMRTAMTIQGRKYVRVEGWQAIAVAHGCVASSCNVERIESGFRAIGEIRRVSDGVTIATAEGFVGDDELNTWAKRPEYARRAMAQTRAISRACRSAFAHVVVLIDGNLSTTPAEEVPEGGFGDEPKSSVTTTQPEPRHTKPASQPAANGGDWRNHVLHFGKNKGTTLGELPEPSLNWYREKWEPKEYPPGSGKFSDADKELRFALDASMSNQPAPAAAQEEQDQVPF